MLRLTVCLALLAAASDRIEYPKAARVDHVDQYHGVPVADPYRWMEDSTAPALKEWIESQNRLAQSFLAAPGREKLIQRLGELSRVASFRAYIDGGSYAPLVKRGGRYFFVKREGSVNQGILYVKDSLDGPERVLLDPNPLSPDGTIALASWTLSPDGKWLSYGLAKGGSDWIEIRVRDVATGRDNGDHLRWVKGGSGSWSADSAGFYYGRFPEPAPGAALTAANYYQKVFHHRAGTPQSEDRLVFEMPEQKDWRFFARETADGRYLLIRIMQGTRREPRVYYRDLKRDPAKTVRLIDHFEAAYDFVGSRESVLYFATTLQAERGRLIAVNLERPARENWREVLPQAEEALEQVVLSRDLLAAVYLRDATSVVKLYTPEGKFVREAPLPGKGSVDWSATAGNDSEHFYSYRSFFDPGTVYNLDGKPVLQPKLPFDPELFETTQRFYKSKDGTRVPMFLSHKRGLRLDGKNPVLLYAYGGFNVSLTPGYNARNVAWMEKGGVYAQANLRGGSEYGEAWHRAGMRDKKQNVFDDFIAAAEWLIANKYTSRARLAISGGSNGGLLVGACLNQRPDLFGAALPAVGVMDMLRFHKFTVGAGWMYEFGNPDAPDDFKVLRAYSPLHNIRKGTVYPPTLITTADHDDRVVPAHSFKYAAAMQYAQEGTAPILIRIETSAGHGAGKPASKEIEGNADALAFLMKVFDMR